MVELFANSGDPDQMPHSAAPDLGLHYICSDERMRTILVNRLED